MDKPNLTGIIGGLFIIFMILLGIVMLFVTSAEENKESKYKEELRLLLYKANDEEAYLTVHYLSSIKFGEYQFESKEQKNDFEEHYNNYLNAIANYNKRVNEVEDIFKGYCGFCSRKVQEINIENPLNR